MATLKYHDPATVVRRIIATLLALLATATLFGVSKWAVADVLLDANFDNEVVNQNIPMGGAAFGEPVGSSRVDLQACKLEYSIVSPK